MATLLSPVNYEFTGAAKPIQLGTEDEKKLVPSFQDYQASMATIEATQGQLITQHNKALLEQEAVISGSGFLDFEDVSGASTLAQTITALNERITVLQTVFTNLNSNPK